MKSIFWVFFSLFFSLAVNATEIPMDIAVLRGLDKVTGRISTFSIPVGQSGQFGKTFIVPEACYTHPPEESPEDSVFLYVFEKSVKGENIELFKGWMFSSNPALSCMEHPVYDIWVIGCEKSPEQEQSATTVKTPAFEVPEVKEKTPEVVQAEPVQNALPETEEHLNLTPAAVEMEEL